MRIKFLNWCNLGFAIVLQMLAILNFCAGNIVVGIFNVVVAGLNFFAFLVAVAVWWKYSPKISEKFVFTCSKCGHQFIPTFWTWFFVPHIGSRRYLKCEKCGKRTWMRRK
jgi:DNA-directed RNA polymerase subunit RPC12/RpoP